MTVTFQGIISRDRVVEYSDVEKIEVYSTYYSVHFEITPRPRNFRVQRDEFEILTVKT